jgi:hypothetical protein
MVRKGVAARRAILYLIVTLPALAPAQDLRERSLEAERRTLEEERREREARRPDLARPVEKKRDAKACEHARVNYQVSCGSRVAPKYRNPNCREAEIFLRQNC